MSEFTQSIITALIPAIIISGVTALVAYFTIKRSMKHFYSQRWWERKADAYSKIIETLTDLELCYREEIDQLTYEERFTDNDKERLRESFRKAQQSITKDAIIGAYIISDDTAKTLSILLSGLKEEDSKGDWTKDLIKHYELVSKSIEEIKKHSKKDLRVK